MTDKTETAPTPEADGIEVKGCFPTPVVIAQTPMDGEENSRLAKTILAHEKETPGVTFSNLSGWQSADDFDQWGGKEGMKGLGIAHSIADRLTGDRAGKPVKVNWRINAWANVNRTSHANDFHAHPGSFLSGCYYVDDGGIGDDPALGGAFQIMDPRGVTPAMYLPELAISLAGCQSAGAAETIAPKTGKMSLFPAWLSHGVRPYLGKGTRISIAFNFFIPPQMESK
jgi:uncharacterized protein (TIGR02466 family)